MLDRAEAIGWLNNAWKLNDCTNGMTPAIFIKKFKKINGNLRKLKLTLYQNEDSDLIIDENEI